MRFAAAPSRVRSRVASLGRRPWLAWLLAQLVAVFPVSLAYSLSSHARLSLVTYLLALGGLLAIQQLAMTRLRRRIGHESPSPADLLTLARASIGTALAALVVVRFTDRQSVVGAVAFLCALLAATALDWLDGPLARRCGPTRLGAVLDIEADSWLTLACALAAVAWGDLPWWVILPSLVRYIQPVVALCRGDLPSGGGPWWSRVTGAAQMVVLLVALAPVDVPHRADVLIILALPVSAAQLAAILALVIVGSGGRMR